MLARRCPSTTQALLAQLPGGEGGDGGDGGEIARRDVAVRALGHAQLMKIAGERRLGDAEAVLAQRGEKLVLGVDGGLPHDPLDLLAPPGGIAGRTG